MRASRRRSERLPVPLLILPLLLLLQTSTTAAAAAAAAAAPLAAPLAAPPPRLILHILADDVGYGSLGYAPNSPASTAGPNGTSLTPTLDALARDGVVLAGHLAPFWCSPSRAALMTGRLDVHVQMGQAMPETPSAGIPRNMSTLAMKLRDVGGWRTLAVGKYDVGIATPDHMPRGRGFDASLVFPAEHMVDTWTAETFPGGSECQLLNPSLVDLWADDGPAVGVNGTGFLEDIFADRVVRAIQENATASPNSPGFYVYWAPKAAHYPLMVDEASYDAFEYVTASGTDEGACNATVPYIWPGKTDGISCRRQGWALVSKLDANIARVVAAVQAVPGLWEQTVLVFSSDNGAPLDLQEGGNGNGALRGGKYANWNGGISTPALVAGGYVPASARGTVRADGLVHIADWYATFLGLANVTDTADHRAAASGLPPVDSVDVWPFITGANATSPRVEVPVSQGALVQWPYKLLRGLQWWSGYGGEIYPNSTSAAQDANSYVDCGTPGCLYDLRTDWNEREDVAGQYPDVAAALSARLTDLIPTFFSNNDTGVDACPKGTLLCACWAAENVWGGYFGPYQV
jgi:arylsulfatase A-like enzyme